MKAIVKNKSLTMEKESFSIVCQNGDVFLRTSVPSANGRNSIIRKGGEYSLSLDAEDSIFLHDYIVFQWKSNKYVGILEYDNRKLLVTIKDLLAEASYPFYQVQFIKRLGNAIEISKEDAMADFNEYYNKKTSYDYIEPETDSIKEETASAIPPKNKLSKELPLEIYTDGSCFSNPGPAGWAYIVTQNEQSFYEKNGFIHSGTNNIAELTAVIEALKKVLQHDFIQVIVKTDSQYVVNAFNQGWLKNWQNRDWYKADGKPVLNAELWKELLNVIGNRNVSFEWVKGHNNNSFNEKCDLLAKTAINQNI